jgi:hypothetical protein
MVFMPPVITPAIGHNEPRRFFFSRRAGKLYYVNQCLTRAERFSTSEKGLVLWSFSPFPHAKNNCIRFYPRMPVDYFFSVFLLFFNIFTHRTDCQYLIYTQIFRLLFQLLFLGLKVFIAIARRRRRGENFFRQAYGAPSP